MSSFHENLSARVGFIDKYDDHKSKHYDITSGQLAFLFVWLGAFMIWIYRKYTSSPKDKCFENAELRESVREVDVKLQPDECDEEKCEEQTTEKAKHQDCGKSVTTLRPTPTFDDFLRCVVMLGVILLYFYLCDYRKVFPPLERTYNRDLFLFLLFLLFLVACAFTVRSTDDKILNRDQTEEWRGWMQVMFVWYHYFAAVEWYNWIRVYIACYVWMTGFGNFSFFWVRQDYSFIRFLKMQFRLNFLVLCVCVVTRNQYMLYYICAMHSYWFISVYCMMKPWNTMNTNRIVMIVKFVVYFAFNFIIFDIHKFTASVFRPFWFILAFSFKDNDIMHEWVYRATLDHWACFFGMICAYNYPHYEKYLMYLESEADTSPFKRAEKRIVKLIMVLFSVALVVIWQFTIMTKDKYDYNGVHPYTSLVLVLAYILLRNSFAFLRKQYIGLFAWLGKITLETYISQLHVYLQSNAKELIAYFPGYALLSFALGTIVYLTISYLLFNLTSSLNAYLFPNDLRTVGKNVLIFILTFGGAYLIAVATNAFIIAFAL